MARLTYQTIGHEGDPWPQWIRDLRTASGVYVIKQHGSDGAVVYVGSSEGRLYDTITRHFQQWKRSPKGRKKAKYNYAGAGYGHDPGLTYQRGRHCVAVVETKKGEAKIAEGNMIARVKPRDNLVANPGGVDHDDVIPF